MFLLDKRITAKVLYAGLSNLNSSLSNIALTEEPQWDRSAYAFFSFFRENLSSGKEGINIEM